MLEKMVKSMQKIHYQKKYEIKLKQIKNCDTKIEDNSMKSAFSINNEIFNFTSFKLAFEETKIYSQNPIFAKIKQNPAIAL